MCGVKVKEGLQLHCPVSSLLIHIIKVRKDSSVFSATVVSDESSLPHVCLMIACLRLLFSNTSSQTVCGYGVTGQSVLDQSYCHFYYRHYSHNKTSLLHAFVVNMWHRFSFRRQETVLII